MRQVLAFFVAVLSVTPASAQIRSHVWMTGLHAPVAFVQDPVFPDVQYVAEKTGLVISVQDGMRLPDPFLSLVGQLSLGDEQGLLGLRLIPTTGRTAACSSSSPISPGTRSSPDSPAVPPTRCGSIPPRGTTWRFQVANDLSVSRSPTTTAGTCVSAPTGTSISPWVTAAVQTTPSDTRRT